MELSKVNNEIGKSEEIITVSASTQQIFPKNKSFLENYGGICMAILASLFFTASFLIVKILGSEEHGFPASGTAVLFNMGVIIPCIPAIIYHEWGPGFERRRRLKEDFWPPSVKKQRITFGILALQGSLQGLSVLLRSEALQYIPVADMTVIVFSSPVVVAILAHFIVKEKFAILPLLLAFVTLGGIFLIMKPPLLTGKSSFDSNTLTGSFFALGALFSLSLKFVVTRSIKEVNFLTMTAFLGVFGLIISVPVFLVQEPLDSIVPKTVTECCLVGGLLLAFCSIASINIALKMELATTVSLVRSLDVIFAFVFQFIFLGVIPDSLSLIGTSLVVFGVLVTAFRKWLQELNPENEIRKKLIFLLI